MKQKTKCRIGIHDWTKWYYKHRDITRHYTYYNRDIKIREFYRSRVCNACGKIRLINDDKVVLE